MASQRLPYAKRPCITRYSCDASESRLCLMLNNCKMIYRKRKSGKIRTQYYYLNENEKKEKKLRKNSKLFTHSQRCTL